MNYKVVCRSQHKPHQFLIRLGDGSLLRDTLEKVPRNVHVGETGTLVTINSHRGPFTRMLPDAIDVEWTNVDK